MKRAGRTLDGREHNDLPWRARNKLITKSDLNLLERVFAAEINGLLPYQSKAAAYKRLEVYGLVEHVEVTLPGKFPVVIPGWILTHKGRMAYCESCKEGN